MGAAFSPQKWVTNSAKHSRFSITLAAIKKKPKQGKNQYIAILIVVPVLRCAAWPPVPAHADGFAAGAAHGVGLERAAHVVFGAVLQRA